MKKLLLFFAVIIGIMLMTGCAKDEENLNGKIAGLVSDYTDANTPIAGATVTLNSKGLTKTTGADGRFEFTDITPGTYTLQIAANNYQTTTKQVSVVAGQTANCDVQLTKSGASVEINPTTLTFGQGVEQLSFNIINNGNQSLTYSISNAPDFIEVSPVSGTVAAKAKNAISVHVLNRSSITTNRNGQLTVHVGNDSYIVSIAVTNNTQTDPNQGSDPNQGGDNPGGNTDNIAVTRGLLVYYTFDDGKTATNMIDTKSYNGQLFESPEFSTGSNSSGYSIHLKKGQYISIPENMLSGKIAYTISMWIKDFGQGALYQTLSNSDQLSPVITINSNDRLNFKFEGVYSAWYDGTYVTFSTNMTNFQSGGWHLITIVKNSSKSTMLYIDGVLVDTKSCDNDDSRGNLVTIGSAKTDPMYVDNVRIHGTALSADEIETIYNKEK